MPNPSLYTLLVLSSVCAILGVALLRLGLRGRLVSRDPHCKKCRFNLKGLDLSKPTPCPECGDLLKTSSNTQTVTILDGLRNKRKIVLCLAMLLLLTSATGYAWPKLRTLPAISTINLYDHFPEPLLTKLATSGDLKAFQTLHARLIPGKVSDKALSKLIEHAFALQADGSVPWDRQWGDVLVYGMIVERLSEEQLDHYLRLSFSILFNGHDLIGSDQDEVYFELGTQSMGEFEYDPGFFHDLRTAGIGASESGDLLDLRLHTFQFSVTTNDEPIDRSQRRGLGGSSGFSFNKGLSAWRLDENFPLDESHLRINIAMEYAVKAGERMIYTWEEQLVHTFERAETPIVHSTPVTDPRIIAEFAESLHVDRVAVPMNLTEAQKHARTQHFGYEVFRVQCDIQSDISLIGKVYFHQVGRLVELEMSQFSFVSDPNKQTSGSRPMHNHRMNLDLYTQNSLFWGQAVIRGSIDIVIIPDLDAYPKRPDVTRYLTDPIIFRDVPIERYQPKYGTAQDQDGNQWEQWGWEQIDPWTNHDPTYGEVYEGSE